MGFNRFFGASILSLAILAGCGGGGDGTAPAAGGGGVDARVRRAQPAHRDRAPRWPYGQLADLR